ncbi:MAG: hypothetical protein NTZ70_02810 [Methylococcales bacterium]|nr:hypothetical protein [Methylococcales bacterium]
MGHFFKEIFVILVQIIEFSEPYLLITTIFFIPFTITITSLPKRFFQYEFTQHLFPALFAKYESKKITIDKLNARTQNLMVVILMIDVFSLGHFFFVEHGVHHGESHQSVDHTSQHVAEAVGKNVPVEH